MDMAAIAGDPHFAARGTIADVDGTPMQALIARLERHAGRAAHRPVVRSTPTATRSAPTAGATSADRRTASGQTAEAERDGADGHGDHDADHLGGTAHPPPVVERAQVE